MDLSEERIRRVRRLNNKIYCLIADVCDLHKLKDNEIDLIISNQIIEHVSNDELMIKEMARVLNREGLIYLSTVFKKWYGWYFYRNRNYHWVIDPTHEREYANDSPLLVYFNKYNLGIVKNEKSL